MALSAIVGTFAVTSASIPQIIGPWHVKGVQWDMGASIALASLAVFGFSRLIRANAELAAMREEVAMLAAERERMRIARDLHDLLGHSLTTVTVKAALAARLFDQDPVRARHEIAEVEVLARESLADVRAAVAGYREVRLATELATAREVLEAAGIDAQLPGVVEGMSRRGRRALRLGGSRRRDERRAAQQGEVGADHPRRDGHRDRRRRIWLHA